MLFRIKELTLLKCNQTYSLYDLKKNGGYTKISLALTYTPLNKKSQGVSIIAFYKKNCTFNKNCTYSNLHYDQSQYQWECVGEYNV